MKADISRKEVSLNKETIKVLSKLAGDEKRSLKNYLETVLNGLADRVFNVNDVIKTKEGKFQCICADNQLAIFAPISGTKTTYKNMFAVGNTLSILGGFEYELIKK